MRQATFTFVPPAVAGSATSEAAARAIEPIAGGLRARLLNYARECGTRGFTDEQAQAALGMDPSTERPRRVELQRMGLIRDSGTTRPTRSGRDATVWVATEDACQTE